MLSSCRLYFVASIVRTFWAAVAPRFLRSSGTKIWAAAAQNYLNVQLLHILCTTTVRRISQCTRLQLFLYEFMYIYTFVS